MEDVLAVYKRPRDGDCPLVCLDEASKQLLADTRVPIPMKPGQPERRDYEYERNGTANLFMMFAPLEGWRHIEITDRRTAIDYARALEDLSDRHFPNAKKIVLVQDNLKSQTSIVVRGFSARQGKTSCRAVRMALYAKARQLARYGGIRTRGSPIAMPRPPHPRQANPHPPSRRLGGRPQCPPRQSRLAVHDR